jgi:hypothetical protein
MSLPFIPIALFAGDVVALGTPFAASSDVIGGTATAQYQLRGSGDVFATTINNVVNFVSNWVKPSASAPAYECFATLNSGAVTGTTGAWLALTANRIWSVTKTGIGSASAQITVQIRRVGTTTILATAVVTLSAIVESPG